MRADSSIVQHFIRMKWKADRNRFAILANPARVKTIVNASGEPVRERQHTRVAARRKPKSPKAQFIHFLATAARAATVASLLYGTGNMLDLQESLHGVFGCGI
jgi:hypothetical protein